MTEDQARLEMFDIKGDDNRYPIRGELGERVWTWHLRHSRKPSREEIAKVTAKYYGEKLETTVHCHLNDDLLTLFEDKPKVGWCSCGHIHQNGVINGESFYEWRAKEGGEISRVPNGWKACPWCLEPRPT